MSGSPRKKVEIESRSKNTRRCSQHMRMFNRHDTFFLRAFVLQRGHQEVHSEHFSRARWSHPNFFWCMVTVRQCHTINSPRFTVTISSHNSPLLVLQNLVHGQLGHLVVLRNLAVATTSSVETSRGHTSHFPIQGRRVVCFRVYFSMSTGSDRKVPISPSRTADPVRRSASEHRLPPRTPVQGPKSRMNYGTCEPKKTPMTKICSMCSLLSDLRLPWNDKKFA